jgi:Putative zinc binding domain
MGGTAFACWGCGAVAKYPIVIDLGSLPLGNSFLEIASETSDVHPLALAFCQQCTLLQTRCDLPPGRRLNEILYFSAVSIRDLRPHQTF